MNHPLPVALVSCLLLRTLLAADLPAVVSAADRDFETYQAAQMEQPETAYQDMSERELAEWGETMGHKLRRLGLAFLEAHPKDPRRWIIVSELSPDFPRFVTDWRQITNAVVDTNAVAAWTRKLTELKAAMAKAEDVPAAVREGQAESEAMKPFHAAMEAAERGEKVDLEGLRRTLLDYAIKRPGSEAAKYMLIYLSAAFETGAPQSARKEWEAFVESPNGHVADFAKQKLSYLDRIRDPLEMAFTAVDGRKVDLRTLRGKVVLVDFWATWCMPCVAELPKIQKLHRSYHDQGLEVVGISLEMANLGSQDSPEQRASKLAKAKGRLVQFVTKREIPWPQYFDGKGWENELAKDYALSGIPTLLVLDKSGRVAAVNPRGEALETEIRRLLQP